MTTNNNTNSNVNNNNQKEIHAIRGPFKPADFCVDLLRGDLATDLLIDAQLEAAHKVQGWNPSSVSDMIVGLIERGINPSDTNMEPEEEIPESPFASMADTIEYFLPLMLMEHMKRSPTEAFAPCVIWHGMMVSFKEMAGGRMMPAYVFAGHWELDVHSGILSTNRTLVPHGSNYYCILRGDRLYVDTTFWR